VVFEDVWKKGDVAKWLDEFQGKVNERAGSDYLKFTAEVWGEDRDDGTVHEMVSGVVLVKEWRALLLSTPEEEPATQIPQQGKRTYRGVLHGDSIRSDEKASFIDNWNCGVREAMDG